MRIDEQVERGALACPATRAPLHWAPSGLVADGRTYPVLPGGVPLLLADPARIDAELAAHDRAMESEYRTPEPTTGLLARMKQRVGAFAPVTDLPPIETFLPLIDDDSLVVSVGGGPLRIHPRLVNLNIGPFPNVDVVGDGYALPYVDGSVDGVHADAVLEHLERPEDAVAEMFRVLRPGGHLFVVTPFLQAFHGYPSHYQNFTTVGHRRLFERAGFDVLDDGVVVGPSFMLADLATKYVRETVRSRFVRAPLTIGLAALFRLLVRRDPALIRSGAASTLASTTYVHAVKP